MAKYVWDEKKQDYVLDSGAGGGSGKSYDRYTWDEKKQDYVKSGKFGGTFGVTPADPDYDAKAYASAAAQDIYDANRFVPSFGKTLTDNLYKIGGSKNISQGNQVQDISNVAGSSGIWQRNLNAGKEQLGLTDEEYEMLLAASEDDEAYAKAMVNIAKARTGGLSSIDMTGMPKAQQQELDRMGSLSARDDTHEKLSQFASRDEAIAAGVDIYGGLSEKEYTEQLMAYYRNELNKNAAQRKYDNWKSAADAATEEAKNIPGYAELSKYKPDNEYLYINEGYLNGYDHYTNAQGETLSAKQYKQKAVDATIAALVDAGNNPDKLAQLESNLALLPELNNLDYNIEAIPYMSDDQRGAFFAKYNSGDVEGAKQYLRDTLDWGLQKKRVETETEQLQKDIENATAWEKALYSAGSVVENLANEGVGASQALAGIFNPKALEKMHEYESAYDAGRSSQTIRSEIGQDIADATENIRIPGTDINIPRMVYNALMSGADSVTNAFLFGGAGAWAPTLAMGAGAFGTEYRDSQNYWDALAAGAIEAGTEYLPFENMGRNAVNPFKKIGAGMLAEGLGESAAEIGNIVYDTVKYKKNSEAQQYIDELLTMGYTPEDALGETVKKYGLEVLEAGLTGAISGGGSASTTAISDSIKNRTLGNNLTNNDGIEPMLDLADSLPLDDTSKDIVRRMREEMAERGKGDKTDAGIDDDASITKEDAEAEAMESEAAARDSAEASELDKGEKADEAIEESATVTKEDAEAAARAEEMTERDRAERADEGKTVEETDAAAVTEEDAEAAVRTARDRGESTDMTRGGRAEAEIDDTASVTEEDVRALTEAEAREWLNDEASWVESDEATESDAAAKDVAEEPSTINADAIASDYADTAAKRGEIEAREAERQQRRNERKAARDKGRKAVTKAEKGYLYRQILANLDKGAQQIVKDNFTRDMRREIEAVGYTGNAKEAAKVLSDFINGEVTPRALELLDGFESLRNIALSYMGKIEMRNNLYKQAGELSERAQKGYVKPEETKADEGADEVTEVEEDDLGYEDMEDDGGDSLSMPERDAGIEVSDTPESTYDGKAVTIESVKTIAKRRGEYEYRVTVKDADGNTYKVSAADISFGSNDGKMAEIMTKARELKTDVDTAISMFNPETQDVSEYIAAWNAASEYGFDGRSIDVVKGDASINSVLTPEQIEAAYNLEREFRREMSDTGGIFSTYRRRRYASVPTGKVDTSAINMRNLKPNQKAAIRAMSSFAKAAGFNLRFVESVADADGKYRTENGSWDPATLTLTLDIHAGSNKAADINYAMMHTAGHELTHFIKQFADGDLWNDYQEFVIGHLSKKGDAFDLDGAIKKHMDRGLFRDSALEEVIADASGEALMNITEADIQSIAETNPTLLNKIKNFFKKWISNLKKRIADAYAGTETKTAEAKQMQDVVDEMSKRWNELFVNATKNKNKAVASETTIESVEDAVASDSDVNPDEKRSLNYRHIDQRTFDSVKDTDTELFVSDAEEAQIGMAAAANILLADLENSIPGQKVWLSDGEVTGQKRQTSELLGRMKDELGLTWDKLELNLQQFADMESTVALPRNSATNRRIELYLHEMLTEGYTALDGTQITPWSEYVEWSQSIEGSEGKKKYSPVEGAVAFEDYAWPGEVKYSIRELSDGTKYTMLDASEIQIDGSTDADSIGRKARLYMRKHYRGKILPVGATKGAYIRNDSINEYTNSAKFLDDNDYENKMIASTELENLLKSSVYKNWRPDNGRHPDAVRGWTTWTTIFAVKPKNAASVIVYEGDVKIKRIARGDLFYDITKIKNITNSTIGRRIIAESQSVGDNLSIPKQKESVKYSERDTDQTQTDAFKRWFGDSKVVNADGTPKVLYHQTNADFSAFDVGRQGAGYLDSEMPSGIYMKDFPDTIKLGPDYKESTQMDLYATIKNPLVFVDRADANRFWKKHVPGYAKMQKELDELNKRYGDEHGKWEALWFDEDDAVSERAMEESDRILEEWTEQENSKRREMHVAIDKYLASSQYDGIILEQDQGTGGTVKTYVALKGTQVKSASKNIGTFDPGDSDIRYQERDYSELSDRELLVQALETDLKPVEREHLERYAGRVSDLDKQQRDLEELHTQIAQMRAEGKTATNSSELLTALDKAKKLRGKIDRADAKLMEIESADMIREVVRRTREETRRKTAEQVRARADERLRREVERVRKVGQTRVKNMQMQREFEKYRKQMLGDVTKLHKWIVSPTSKGSAPEFLREPLAKFIDAFNYDSETKLRGRGETYSDADFKEMLENLRDAISKLTDQQSDIEEGAETFMGYIDLPANFRQDFDDNIRSIRKALDIGGKNADTPIAKMTADQMKELATAFRILNHSIRNINRFVSNGKYMSAKNAADDTIDDMNEMKAREKTNKGLETLNSIFNWKNTTPYYAFQRLGRGGRAIFEGLQDGWDRMARNSARLVEYAKKTFTDKESEAWSGEITEVKLDSGDTIKMTTAQKMSLYCLQKRPQAHGHLLGGGIRVSDIEGKRGSKISQADNYVLTVEDISRITGSLTKRQRDVADALQEFMNTVCAEWGNEISMKRFGFRQMTELFYFPIETDANNRRSIDETKDGKTSMFRLLNMSSLKQLTPKANNAIIINDIFNVFADHASDMAKYNALALPILDFIKWYNHVERSDVRDSEGQATGQIRTRSTQKALERVYGKDAKEYLTAFIRDLNAEHDGGRNDGLINSIVGKAKSAAVGANLRVYALQITSLPRAAYAINPKYLIAGAAKLKSLNPVSAIKGTEAQEKVGILKWKSLGFYSTDISRSTREMVKRNDGFFGKLKEWQMAPAGWGDNWVSNIIYEAVKAEMRDKHPTVATGSATYNEMVNRRVREIIYKTQVVDSTMTRSDFMRSKGLASTLTAFMSEPTLTVNMLNESIQKAVELGRKGGNTREILRATGGLAARAASTWIFTSIATTLVESVMDAIRDDDEYERFLEKFWNAVWGEKWYNGNIVQNLNPITMFPILNDLWSIVVEGYEDNSLIMQVGTQFRSFMDAVNSYRKGNSTLYNVIYKGTQTASSMSGIGAANLARDGVALYNTFLAPAFDTPKVQTSVDSEKTVATAMYKAAMSGDAAGFEKLIGRAELYGITAEDLENKYNNLVSSDYLEGNINSDEAKRVFKMYGGKTEYQAQTLVDKLDYEKATGRKYSKVESEYVSGAISKADAKNALTTYGDTTAADADAKILTWDYEKATGRKYSAINNEYIRGVISRSEIKKAMVNYGGQNSEEAEKAILHLDYQKKTNRPWNKLMDDYIGGRFTRGQVKDYLMNYDLKDENAALDTIDKYDWAKTHGGSTDGYSKYVTVHEAIDSGSGFDEAVEALVEKYTARGETRKEVLSSIRSSITSTYKPIYLAASEAERARMREKLLDVYVALGGSYNTYYKNMTDKWFDD